MDKKSCFWIILAGILWGSSALFVNRLSPLGFSSIMMTGMRGIISAIIMVAFALIKDRSLFKIKPKNILLNIASGTTLFTTAYTYYTCMTKTSVSTAVILMYTAPILVLIYSVIFFKEKLTKLKAIAVFFMLVGCALVAGVVGGMKFDAIGILFGILSGISYGSYNILTKIEVRRSMNPLSISLYNFLVMVVIAFFVSDIPKIVSLSVNKPCYSVLMIFLLGLCTCILPYVFYNMGMKKLPAGVASALGIVEPMSATLFGIALGERLTLFPTIGIILIIGSVFALSQCKE